jgi:hypothetical protein
MGSSHGRRLLGSDSAVRDTPASANDLLAEAVNHDLVVVIAHGEVLGPEDASILCVDGRGEIDRLDIARLAADPGAFAGSTVLLLSCEGGRVGPGIAEPGGLAGTLISAGARSVVGPLWPVRLDQAVHVAKAIIAGLNAGRDPSETLATIGEEDRHRGPVMGPPPSLAQQRILAFVQKLSFVNWVG